MPTDPRLWLQAPPRSSYPACLAVKAAAEQGLEGAYLRVAARGADGSPAQARHRRRARRRRAGARRPGRRALRDRPASNATVEAFGADLERAREAAREGEERVPLPTFRVGGDDGEPAWLYGDGDPQRLRAAVLAAGARPRPLPDVSEAVRRFGRVATVEVAAACDRPVPLAAAELWRLATEWRVRPQRALTGELWSAS